MRSRPFFNIRVRGWRDWLRIQFDGRVGSAKKKIIIYRLVDHCAIIVQLRLIGWNCQVP